MPQSYGTFINVDGSRLGALKSAPERYESSVIEMLKQVSRFKVGWLVLNAIKQTGKQVLIRPTNDGHDEAVQRDIVHMPEQPYVINLMCDLADRIGECPDEMREKLYYAPSNRFGDAIIDFDPENRVKPFLPRALLHGIPGRVVDKLFLQRFRALHRSTEPWRWRDRASLVSPTAMSLLTSGCQE